MPATTRRRSGATAADARVGVFSSPVVKKSRKRNSSVKEEENDGNTNLREQDSSLISTAQTPSGRSKRVRFSTDLSLVSSPGQTNNTGLTPFMRRANLSARRQRRQSTPCSHSSARTPSSRGVRGQSSPSAMLPSPPPSSPLSNIAEFRTMQFVPMRQALDEKMRRRLRRSGLSEHQNALMNEDRSARKGETFAARQKEERLNAQIEELLWENEVLRQNEIDVDGVVGTENAGRQEREAKIKALREELVALEQEEQLTGLALALPPSSPPLQPIDDDDINDEDLMRMDTTMVNWENCEGAQQELPSSPSARRSLRISFNPQEGLMSPGSTILFEPSSPLSFPSPSTYVDSATQAQPLQDSAHERTITSLKEAIESLTTEKEDAHSILENLHNALIQLGLLPPSESLEQTPTHLHQTLQQYRLELESLLPGESPNGSTTTYTRLLSTMLHHISTLQSTTTQAQSSLQRKEAEHSTLLSNFNTCIAENRSLTERLEVISAHRTSLVRSIEALEQELEDAKREAADSSMHLEGATAELSRLKSKHAFSLQEAEKEKREQSTAVQRLQAAVTSYRDEVSSLEALVMSMEAAAGEAAKASEEQLLISKKEAEALRAELDVTVAALGRAEEKLKEVEAWKESVTNGVGEMAFELQVLVRPELASVTRRKSKGKGMKVGDGSEEGEVNGEMVGEREKGKKRDSGVGVDVDGE